MKSNYFSQTIKCLGSNSLYFPRLLIILLCFLFARVAFAEDRRLRKGKWDYMFNPKDLVEDNLNYHKENGVIFSKLSYLSYYGEKDLEYAENIFRKKYPTLNIKLELKRISGGTQVLLFGCVDYTVVCFRGTEFLRIKDLITDLKFFNYKNPKGLEDKWGGLLPGHGGFRKASINSINEGLLDHIKVFSSQYQLNQPIYTTGHSLGGGIALMMINPINNYNLNYQGTYTFSSPLVFSRLCDDTIGISELHSSYANRIHNIINNRDYVARAGKTITKSSLGIIGHSYHLCKNEELVQTNPVPIKLYGWDKRKFIKYHRIKHIVTGLNLPINNTTELVKRTNESCICNEDKQFEQKLVPLSLDYTFKCNTSSKTSK